ncbi:MAG: cryptochrome/photolyase family protein, partial [Candidatus Kariarchaeum pelagius]
MVNTLIYISADQLFHSHSALSIDDQCVVLMFEDTEFLLSYKFHKHKLIFIISAMRQYFQQLNAKNKFYYKLNLDNASNTLEN